MYLENLVKIALFNYAKSELEKGGVIANDIAVSLVESGHLKPEDLESPVVEEIEDLLKSWKPSE